ncbi:OmpA family protein [Burkholderia pseudomultivorans]|uniref:OmpA family protein n=1 Tax=Burkholderia pseudomultivorans TaxID=1207504 RepID=UPI0012D942DD|nr:OmpA family protein [Burkholderia pseudomultivorans]
MKKLIAVVMVLLAGCTVYSGPTVNSRLLDPKQDQPKEFQVECTGLFEETNSCLEKAQELCGIQPGALHVHVLEQIGPRGRTPDRLVFRCDAPEKPIAPPAPAPAPAAVVPAPTSVLLRGDALFDFDKANLKPAGVRALDEVIDNARGKRFRLVEVAGYTDSIGSDSYNNALSLRRAKSVADYLRAHGLDAERMAVDGFGKSNPVASNATDAGRAQNRRVEIVLEQE